MSSAEYVSGITQALVLCSASYSAITVHPYRSPETSFLPPASIAVPGLPFVEMVGQVLGLFLGAIPPGCSGIVAGG